MIREAWEWLVACVQGIVIWCVLATVIFGGTALVLEILFPNA
jgi:hypothetical protein